MRFYCFRDSPLLHLCFLITHPNKVCSRFERIKWKFKVHTLRLVNFRPFLCHFHRRGGEMCHCQICISAATVRATKFDFGVPPEYTLMRFVVIITAVRLQPYQVSECAHPCFISRAQTTFATDEHANSSGSRGKTNLYSRHYMCVR